MSLKGDAYGAMEETTKENLQKLGLNQVWTEEMYTQSYIAVMSDEEIVENTGGKITKQGIFNRKEQTYSIVSTGYNDGTVSSIKIDDEEYSEDLPGLNIVVYDLITNRVVDSVCFDTGVDSAAYR